MLVQDPRFGKQESISTTGRTSEGITEMEDWEERLLAPFRRAAQERGGAELEFDKGGPTGEATEVTLTSSDPSGARLSVLMMGPSEVDGTLGEAFPLELWYPEDKIEELVRDLEGLVAAVLEGQLEETVWRRGGQVVKARGTLISDGKKTRLYYRSLPATLGNLGRSEKTVHRYAPYPA